MRFVVDWVSLWWGAGSHWVCRRTRDSDKSERDCGRVWFWRQPCRALRDRRTRRAAPHEDLRCDRPLHGDHVVVRAFPCGQRCELLRASSRDQDDQQDSRDDARR